MNWESYDSNGHFPANMFHNVGINLGLFSDKKGIVSNSFVLLLHSLFHMLLHAYDTYHDQRIYCIIHTVFYHSYKSTQSSHVQEKSFLSNYRVVICLIQLLVNEKKNTSNKSRHFIFSYLAMFFKESKYQMHV